MAPQRVGITSNRNVHLWMDTHAAIGHFLQSPSAQNQAFEGNQDISAHNLWIMDYPYTSLCHFYHNCSGLFTIILFRWNDIPSHSRISGDSILHYQVDTESSFYLYIVRCPVLDFGDSKQHRKDCRKKANGLNKEARSVSLFQSKNTTYFLRISPHIGPPYLWLPLPASWRIWIFNPIERTLTGRTTKMEQWIL